jgi:hypothetical protein
VIDVGIGCGSYRSYLYTATVVQEQKLSATKAVSSHGLRISPSSQSKTQTDLRRFRQLHAEVDFWGVRVVLRPSRLKIPRTTKLGECAMGTLVWGRRRRGKPEVVESF